MSKLTEASRNQECTLQIYPYCNGMTETTVPAHLNSEQKGWGNKSPDWWLVDACSNCHAIIDGHMKTDLDELEVLKCQFRGLFRTLRRRIREQQLIKVPRGCE
ncbi:MAG: hypothetical protein Hals2KO_21390 [Halioglobus sp.]